MPAGIDTERISKDTMMLLNSSCPAVSGSMIAKAIIALI